MIGAKLALQALGCEHVRSRHDTNIIDYNIDMRYISLGVNGFGGLTHSK